MTNKEYNIKRDKKIHDYCYICQKRNGTKYAYCGPGLAYGRHGSKKLISSSKWRSFKSWKHNRKKQWK